MNPKPGETTTPPPVTTTPVVPVAGRQPGEEIVQISRTELDSLRDRANGLRGNLMQVQTQQQQAQTDLEAARTLNTNLTSQMANLQAQMSVFTQALPQLQQWALRGQRLEELAKHPALNASEGLKEVFLTVDLPADQVAALMTKVNAELEARTPPAPAPATAPNPAPAPAPAPVPAGTLTPAPAPAPVGTPAPAPAGTLQTAPPQAAAAPAPGVTPSVQPQVQTPAAPPPNLMQLLLGQSQVVSPQPVTQPPVATPVPVPPGAVPPTPALPQGPPPVNAAHLTQPTNGLAAQLDAAIDAGDVDATFALLQRDVLPYVPAPNIGQPTT